MNRDLRFLGRSFVPIILISDHFVLKTVLRHSI